MLNNNKNNKNFKDIEARAAWARAKKSKMILSWLILQYQNIIGTRDISMLRSYEDGIVLKKREEGPFLHHWQPT